MNRLLRRLRPTHLDAKLNRTIVVVRGCCAMLLVGLAALLVAAAADGTMEVSVSRTGARYGGASVLRTFVWADSPLVYLLLLAMHLAIATGLVAALYVVLARVVERTHGRRILPFRKRYPY